MEAKSLQRLNQQATFTLILLRKCQAFLIIVNVPIQCLQGPQLLITCLRQQIGKYLYRGVHCTAVLMMFTKMCTVLL